jgi:cytochrome c biogenesis protein CcdA
MPTMGLLLLFALIAGAGTAITPCVLPVLPALLSASVTGGRRPGEDVKRGAVAVTGERLYRLVSLPEAQEHRLTLRFDEGVTGYAFTFG